MSPERWLGRMQFLYKIQPVRPELLTIGPTADEKEIIAQHFSYLKRSRRWIWCWDKHWVYSLEELYLDMCPNTSSSLSNSSCGVDAKVSPYG